MLFEDSIMHGKHVLYHAYVIAEDRFVAWIDEADARFTSDYRDDAIEQAKAFADGLA